MVAGATSNNCITLHNTIINRKGVVNGETERFFNHSTGSLNCEYVYVIHIGLQYHTDVYLVWWDDMDGASLMQPFPL